MFQEASDILRMKLWKCGVPADFAQKWGETLEG